MNNSTWLHTAWIVAKTITARLRFIALLVAVGAVIMYWDVMTAWYEKLTRPLAMHAAVSSDIEFWCPMHPTIIRDHADKCPICAMPLSKRKKGQPGDDEPLPPGVIGRVQLSPYRVALAGVQTVPVTVRKLAKAIRAIGFVEYDERRLARISSRIAGKSRIDKLFVNVTGQMVKKGEPLAQLYSPDLIVTAQNLVDARQAKNEFLERTIRERLLLWGIDKEQVDKILQTGEAITQVTIRSPIHGHVIRKYHQEGDYLDEGEPLYELADLSTVWIEAQVYEDEMAFLKPGLSVTATTKVFPSRTFVGQLAFVHPHLDSATRTLRVRFDMDNPRHDLRPGMYTTVEFEVVTAESETFRNKFQEDWRNRLRLEVMTRGAGVDALLSAAVELAQLQQGYVLAVPESAVIDTGTRKIVYRESLPGVYDAVLVELGARSGEYYPVVRGLEAGELVASAGSFLIDAETRLNAGAASTYFGASGGPQDARASTVRPSMTENEDLKIKAALAKLPAADRALAQTQVYCPILKGSQLGAMGVPVKVMLKGEPVFLCCRGCVEKANEHADETLAIVRKLRSK